MLKNIDYKEIAILIDFDGTITTEDTNVKLINKYGSNVSNIKEEFKEGKIAFTEYFSAEMDTVRITKEKYIKFMLEDIEISPGFIEFYKKVKEENIRIGIISGGFEEGIIPFLEKHKIEDMDIFANNLKFKGDRPSIKYLDGDNKDCCDLGPCGNCKIDHYHDYKELSEKIIFIGDGVTDMPVANVAEIVFAKDSLADYLDEREIDYFKYKDFNDINDLIFN